eukprot:6162946-Prymnesium_polylepis.1
MHILVRSDTHRAAVVIQGSATIAELKEKVEKQSGISAATMELRFDGEPLADEMTLSEQGIQDRDRIEMVVTDPNAPASSGAASGALDEALAALDGKKAAIDELEAKVRRREPAHQELFTRVLEGLDNIELDGYVLRASRECDNPRGIPMYAALVGLIRVRACAARRLSDAQRSEVRPVRKALVKRCEALSAQAQELKK